MAKQMSRPRRWAAAAETARVALDELREQHAEVISALEALGEVQTEYTDWYDNMPESLQQGATGEKLSELIDLDFSLDDSATIEDLEEAIEAAENADLPMGFGRD